MKFFIEDKILHSVKLSNAGYSATNQGKINTYNLLKEYAPLKKRINLIDTLPKQMITLAGLSDKIEEVEQIQVFQTMLQTIFFLRIHMIDIHFHVGTFL